MKQENTIAAISTPHGEGGIGIVRLSGQKAIQIIEKIFRPNKKNFNLRSHSIIYGNIIIPSTNEIIDEVLVTIMKSPHSYTKEDVIEINCHGGFIVLKEILQLVLNYGARLAEPGEFTKRAFLNGRIDLTQAEAVIDIIRAKTDKSMHQAQKQLQGNISKEIASLRNLLIDITSGLELSVDFIEDDIEIISYNQIHNKLLQILEKIEKLIATFNTGKIIREGIKIAIIGKPNVGKSSLLNTLLNEERAIVTHVPGTTRDVIEEMLNIKGIPATIIDTAGIRKTTDIIEKIGIERTRKSILEANIVLLLLDISAPLQKEDLEIMKEIENKKTILVFNKLDKIADKENTFQIENTHLNLPAIKISAITKEGIENLKNIIYNSIINDHIEIDNEILINNIRHAEALNSAKNSLKRAYDGIQSKLSPEFIASDIREASSYLGNIMGKTFTDDILNYIFKNFCIGK